MILEALTLFVSAAAQFNAFQDTWEWNQPSVAHYEEIAEHSVAATIPLNRSNRTCRMNNRMAFRVFLTYSLDPSEQALAWRLQTLAAAHGIEVYVPRRDAGRPRLAETISVQSAIDRSDCLLAIITAKVDARMQKELEYALQKQKLVIPIVQSDFAKHPLLAKFPRIFIFSASDDPGALESKVVVFLKEQNLSKERQQAIGAVAAAGLALLLLFALSEK